MAKPKTRKKTIRREAFEGVEPDAAEHIDGRPRRGQRRPDLGQIIENGLVMLMPFIVERIVAAATSEDRHPPAPAAAERPVDFDRSGGLSQRTCAGNRPYCGSRMVLNHWTFCPYCATELRAVQ